MGIRRGEEVVLQRVLLGKVDKIGGVRYVQFSGFGVVKEIGFDVCLWFF